MNEKSIPAFGFLSLRDLYAGVALHALLTGRAWGDDTSAEKMLEIWAASSFALADAMLKARSNDNQ